MIKIKFQDQNGAEAVREFAGVESLKARSSEIDNAYEALGSSVGADYAALVSEQDAIGDALLACIAAKLRIHKPSSFEPSDYEVVDYIDNQPPKFYPPGFGMPAHIMDAAIAAWRRERDAWHANNQRLFPNRHETGVSIHQCTHCGCRNVRYIAAVYHKPSGQNVVFGSDCVERLGFANQSAFKAAQIKARAEAGHARMKIIAARAKFIAAHPELVPAMAAINEPVHARNNFARDIIAKLNQYGSLSPRQVECLVSSLQRDHEYAAKRAADASKPKGPVPVGKRIEFSGVVLSHKWQENDFGGCTKMLVELENGSRIWMTAPSALSTDGLKGAKLRLRATVEASKDDPSFGFAKRPHLISSEAPVATVQNTSPEPRNNCGEGA